MGVFKIFAENSMHTIAFNPRTHKTPFSFHVTLCASFYLSFDL